jgi:serine/threonine-protein kinase
MTISADLERWGEPPASSDEEALADLLASALEARGGSVPLPRQGAAVLQTAGWLDELVSSVLAQADASALPDPFPGEFRVRRFLGKGAFSNVWLADDLGLGIPVALKILRFADTPDDHAAALAAMRQEARVLAGLEHPNIVRVYALRPADGEHCLILRYVAGGSLEARLERDGPLDWRQAARYIADVGDALAHVHARQIVHRDLKPANILWDADRDEALLTDFGLAAYLGGPARAAGSPLFMAPEAFNGQATTAGDVYGLAATLFYLLTATVPFPASSVPELLRSINQGLPDPEPRFASVPAALERLVRAGLAVQPERRPPLSDFVTALRGALNQLLADALVPAAAPVGLRLGVARWEGGTVYTPVAATYPMQPTGQRNLARVPPLPARVALRTGDRLRIDVTADKGGHVALFNVGPTGELSLLYPEAPSPTPPLRAGVPLHVFDVALTPPAGRERLFALWSRVPLPLSAERLFRLVQGETVVLSRSYQATRNLERVRASVGQLAADDWQAAVLELDHEAAD